MQVANDIAKRVANDIAKRVANDIAKSYFIFDLNWIFLIYIKFSYIFEILTFNYI